MSIDVQPVLRANRPCLLAALGAITMRKSNGQWKRLLSLIPPFWSCWIVDNITKQSRPHTTKLLHIPPLSLQANRLGPQVWHGFGALDWTPQEHTSQAQRYSEKHVASWQGPTRLKSRATGSCPPPSPGTTVVVDHPRSQCCS